MASSGSASSNAGDVTASTPAPAPSGVSFTTSPTSKDVSLNAGDTCGCRASGLVRTCFECLNMKLQNGETCAVNPYGACMTSATAVAYEPYFSTSVNNSVTPHGNKFFWSSNTTYCLTDDDTCAACRVQWITSYRAQSLRTNFSCAGAGGCICSAYCELRDASDNISLPSAYDTGGEYCSAAVTGSTGSRHNMNTIINSITLIGAAIMMAGMLRSGITQFRQRGFQLNAAARCRAERIERIIARSSRLTLNLEGWNSYREQLIGHEQQSLGLNTDSLLSEAPSRVIVEEGEGFRPASPTQHVQHSAHGP